MPIFRSPKDKHFTQVCNRTIRDPRISYEALGILVRSLSNVDTWVPTADELRREPSCPHVTNNREGRDSIESALRELKEFGYREINTARDSNGQFRSTVNLYESPLVPVPDDPATGNPVPEIQVPGNAASVHQLSDIQGSLEDHIEHHVEDQENTQSQNTYQEDIVESVDLRMQEEVVVSNFERVISDHAKDVLVSRYIKPFWTAITSETLVPDFMTADQGLDLLFEIFDIQTGNSGPGYRARTDLAAWIRAAPRSLQDLLDGGQQVYEVVNHTRAGVSLLSAEDSIGLSPAE